MSRHLRMIWEGESGRHTVQCVNGKIIRNPVRQHMDANGRPTIPCGPDHDSGAERSTVREAERTLFQGKGRTIIHHSDKYGTERQEATRLVKKWKEERQKEMVVSLRKKWNPTLRCGKYKP